MQEENGCRHRLSPYGFSRVLSELREEFLSVMRSLVPRIQCLPCPNFVVSETMSEWGSFRAGNLEARDFGDITFSARLLLEHPWYAVKDVLVHEAAHFAVWLLHGDAQETAHGPLFRQYCQRLGGSVRASGNYPPLDVSLLDDASPESQCSPMELRIRKLLALAESPNEHEAELALLKAHELMARYGLEEATMSEDRDPYICVGVDLPGARLPREERDMMRLLCQHFAVEGVICYHPRLENGTWGSGIGYELLGRRSKVKVALYVRDYLWNLVEMRAVDAHGVRLRPRRRRSFVLGLLNGLSEKLSAQAQDFARNESTYALVLAEQERLQVFVKGRYPRLCKCRGSAVRISAQDYAAGESLGRKLEIASALPERSQRRQLT